MHFLVVQDASFIIVLQRKCLCASPLGKTNCENPALSLKTCFPVYYWNGSVIHSFHVFFPSIALS